MAAVVQSGRAAGARPAASSPLPQAGRQDRHCSQCQVVGFDGAPGRFFFLEF